MSQACRCIIQFSLRVVVRKGKAREKRKRRVTQPFFSLTMCPQYNEKWSASKYCLLFAHFYAANVMGVLFISLTNKIKKWTTLRGGKLLK